MRKYLVIALLCLFVGAANGQKFLDKPFDRWSRDDAGKVLNESSWVQLYQSTEGLAAIEKDSMLNDQDTTRSKAPGPRATDARAEARDLGVAAIIVRLHSSPMIRQAYVRLRQIAAKYDDMDQDKRAAFDASVKDVLDCPLCKNYYIVTMTKSINASHENVEDGLFQTTTPEQMKGMIWLVNDAGVRSPLARFIPPKTAADQAVFFFPRRDDKGNELISPTSKSFKIEFSGEFFTNANPYSKIIPHGFDFDVSKIVRKDQVLF